MASSSDWKAPAALPPWAEVDDKDDKSMKNVKNLLSAQYGLLCEMKSKYIAKKRYSEELERFVKNGRKEVEELNNKIMQQDTDIIQKGQGDHSEGREHPPTEGIASVSEPPVASVPDAIGGKVPPLIAFRSRWR